MFLVRKTASSFPPKGNLDWLLQRLNFPNKTTVKKPALEAGETAQQLGALTALAEELSPIPSNHVRQLTTFHSPRSQGFNALLWLLRAPACIPHT